LDADKKITTSIIIVEIKMRIWSLHPKYLDAKGLVALWRETLLAKNVLDGKTVGYKNHPQLNRFKQEKKPVEAINHYLSEIYLESVNRNYNFDIQKINWHFKKSKLIVTTGQLNYEVKHLLVKLKTRDVNKYQELSTKLTFDIHPLFKLVDGDIESWELMAKKGNIASR
jgi:DUF4097 and DUF4098 domain-containing protein YvlB